MKRLLGLAAIVMALLSCSGKPPSLLSLRWYLVDRPLEGKQGMAQAMSVFAAVQDPDGLDDIEEFYLICDSSRYFWKLTDETWEKKDLEGNVWIGSNGFSFPSGGDFPDGTYRVLIVDSGGERAEREISLNMSGRPRPAPLSLNLQGDTLDIQSPFSSCQVMVLDANGDGLLAVPARNGPQSLKALVSAYPEHTLGRSVVAISISEGSNRAVMSPRVNLP